MHITFATVEPYGGYHLAPLKAGGIQRGHKLDHLVPAPRPTGQGVIDTVDKLAGCDRVVITGGNLTEWGEHVARQAIKRGIPCVFVELAYTTSQPHPHPPKFDAVVAGSTSGADNLALHLQTDGIKIVGTCSLDQLPERKPKPKRVLAVTTVSDETPDSGATLKQGVDILSLAGWDVVVRCHPREPLKQWKTYQIDENEQLSDSLKESEKMFGYAGTATVMAAGMGVGMCALATETWMLVEPTITDACWLVETLDDLPGVIARTKPAGLETVNHLCGPIGGASTRLFQAIEQAK